MRGFLDRTMWLAWWLQTIPGGREVATSDRERWGDLERQGIKQVALPLAHLFKCQ